MGDYLVKTSNYLTLAGAALCLAGLSVPASASTTITGNSTLTFNDSDPGLVVYANSNPFSGVLNNVGDSFTTQVLTIGTNESTVNVFEDLVSYPITATFSFSSPAGAVGPAITGTTSGFIQLFTSCGAIAGGCGQVTWDGPSEFDFGGIGKFSLSLSDATFGTPGSAAVNGTFTLLAAVPEPSTWAMLILGFGAVGFMMRSRRRQNVSVSYA